MPMNVVALFIAYALGVPEAAARFQTSGPDGCIRRAAPIIEGHAWRCAAEATASGFAARFGHGSSIGTLRW